MTVRPRYACSSANAERHHWRYASIYIEVPISYNITPLVIILDMVHWASPRPAAHIALELGMGLDEIRRYSNNVYSTGIEEEYIAYATALEHKSNQFQSFRTQVAYFDRAINSSRLSFRAQYYKQGLSFPLRASTHISKYFPSAVISIETKYLWPNTFHEDCTSSHCIQSYLNLQSLMWKVPIEHLMIRVTYYGAIWTHQ